MLLVCCVSVCVCLRERWGVYVREIERGREREYVCACNVKLWWIMCYLCIVTIKGIEISYRFSSGHISV